MSSILRREGARKRMFKCCAKEWMLIRYRDLLCPMLKKVFGDLNCVSPKVGGSPMCGNRMSTENWTGILHHLTHRAILTFCGHAILFSSPVIGRFHSISHT